MNPFKNLIVNLQATGIAAVAAVWLICMTLLALFAPLDSPLASTTQMSLMFFGGLLGVGLIQRRD